jgi:hypothetical protein
MCREPTRLVVVAGSVTRRCRGCGCLIVRYTTLKRRAVLLEKDTVRVDPWLESDEEGRLLILVEGIVHHLADCPGSREPE